MISGFARVGRLLGKEEYVERAERALEFVRKYMYNPSDARLTHSCYTEHDGSITNMYSLHLLQYLLFHLRVHRCSH